MEISKYVKTGCGIFFAAVALGGLGYLVALPILCGLGKQTILTSSNLPTNLGGMLFLASFAALIIGGTAAYNLLEKSKEKNIGYLEQEKAPALPHQQAGDI